MTMTFDVGVDVDDVLFPWTERIHAACTAAGITNGARVTRWNFHEDYGCTRQEFWDVVLASYCKGLLLGPPIDGVVASLHALLAFGHRVHLVTARGFEGGRMGDTVRHDTRLWLAEYGIPHTSLTFAMNKRDVETDYFVDDSIGNVTALRASGVEAYLHDQPHNRTDFILPRVNSLSAFASIVLGEANVMANY